MRTFAAFAGLFDDLATMLDDVAVLAKATGTKTAGVLGDDLALNAEQVIGVRPEKETAIVMAVAKGALVNKAILIPIALLISMFVPWMILPLLCIGGAFLCFEGVEKIIETYFSKHKEVKKESISCMSVDQVLQYEKNKITAAIRTDFILSAEIMAIALSVVASASIATQIMVLTVVAVLVTLFVYGTVAFILKLDDIGLVWVRTNNQYKIKFGYWLLSAAPKIMRFLSVFGTIAMFLVGGGIYVHGFEYIHHIISHLQVSQITIVNELIAATSTMMIGVALGSAIVLIVHMCSKLYSFID